MDIAKYLDELRVSAREKYVPVMRKETTEMLADIARRLRPKEILEIGTSYGVSGIAVLAATEGRLTTIDKDGDVIAVAENNFRECGVRDRVVFVEGDCFEVLDILGDNRYDLAIIDGPKGHYYELFLRIMPLINKGGVIFCDDVDYFGWVKEGRADRKHRQIINGMKRFFDKVTSDSRVKAEFFPIEDGVAVITVKGEEEE